MAPSEKYEIFVSVLTGQATQREAAEQFKVDRSTVVHVCRVAKQGALDALAASVPGRRAASGKSAEQIRLEETAAEIERLRATVLSSAANQLSGAWPGGKVQVSGLVVDDTSRIA
ncbi:helix-turn-helix domain-containing protein [Serinicoccus sp. CUA-874]|uniref:helix-turn-helix domain-containing protein n=1 Tax=Serinicoccus sp. CUA-874 TaxID=1517939 RepID=UPI001650E833|nr:helix-turn-helix domain-containing protein [Serinicoccus sp. CUA-874]